MLATSLSASAIVMGKWWAAFRAVPLMATLPLLSSVILAAGAPTLPILPSAIQAPSPPIPLRPIDRGAVPAVVLGQVVVYGELFVSLGIWFATRCRRPPARGRSLDSRDLRGDCFLRAGDE